MGPFQRHIGENNSGKKLTGGLPTLQVDGVLPSGQAIGAPGAEVIVVGSGFLQPALPSAACRWTLSDANRPESTVTVPLFVHSSSRATCAPPDGAAIGVRATLSAFYHENETNFTVRCPVEL